MSFLADHYAEAMVTMHEIKQATATTQQKPTQYPDSNSDSYPYVANPAMIPLDRIASLSEQIAMLEERLEVCKYILLQMSKLMKSLVFNFCCMRLLKYH